jgi:selenoprotein W-related protein
MSAKACIQIEYCTQCGFLLRAAWMAQELLRAFEQELQQVALVPVRGGFRKPRSSSC